MQLRRQADLEAPVGERLGLTVADAPGTDVRVTIDPDKAALVPATT